MMSEPCSGVSADAAPLATTRPSAPSMAEVLRIERIDAQTFRRPPRTTQTRRLFGGEAFALAILAATQAIGDGRVVTSAQAHFLRPGSTSEELLLRTTGVRDGGSFSVRSVGVEQSGKTILTLLLSAQTPEDGLTHQLTTETVPAPETLPDPEEMFHDDDQNLQWIRSLLRRNPIECRFVDWPPRASAIRGVPAEPRQRVWVRATGPRIEDDNTARAATAYISDLFLLATSVAPHGRTIQDPDLQFATLDHSVWFHSTAVSDDWLLYDQHGIWTGGGRALCKGSFHTRSGELVATVMQQALLRVRGDRSEHAARLTPVSPMETD